MISQSELRSILRARKEVRFFNPLTVANLRAWYDTSDFNTVTVDANDLVGQLNDKSGNGYTLTQATTGNKPTYKYSGGLNGLGFINFPAGTRNITNAAFVYAQPYTLYFVVRQNSIIHHSNIIQFNGALNGVSQIVTTPTNGNVRNCLGPVAATNWAGTNLFGTYNTNFAVFKMVFNLDGVNSYISMNDSIPVATTQNPGVQGTSNIMIGSSISNPNFDFYELLFYSGLVSDDDDRNIHEYLLDKYGIQQADQYVMFGDSITSGGGATDGSSTGWAALVPYEKSKFISNLGVAGAGVYARSGTTHLINLVYKGKLNPNAWFVLCYGTNDAVDTDTLWQGIYQALVSRLIAWGASKSKIILLTPPYQSNKLAKLTAAQSQTQAIATALGVNFCDYWTWSKNNGGDTLLADGTHPNDTGHRTIANMIEGFIN